MSQMTRATEGGLAALKVFDSHCHLPMDGDFKSVKANNQLVCGIYESNWTHVQQLEKSNIKGVRVGYGIHPWWAGDRTPTWKEALEKLIASSPTAVVGEIGLDKIKGPPMDEQVSIFKEQLALAATYSRPVSVHCVRAYGALEAVICSKKDPLPKTVILHSWNGSPDTTKMLLKKSRVILYFGFSPMVVKGTKFPALLSVVPTDRILVESDSHDPLTSMDDVEKVISVLSDLLSVPHDELVQLTAANAETALSII
eukprot:TRINITY_DN5738_c0_g2_i1.p1 TRINITY_DN5738_c0_g2~~TRINITY_DN5738_c0_g2_i1.p1  ORF type:complete len:255 (+),score=28.83 TRINITY_DN5738_c0_g2_i1:71-835(+)